MMGITSVIWKYWRMCSDSLDQLNSLTEIINCSFSVCNVMLFFFFGLSFHMKKLKPAIYIPVYLKLHLELMSVPEG